MFEKKFSILKKLQWERYYWAIIIGLLGFLPLYISLKYSMTEDYDPVLCGFIEKLGEILIGTGLIVIILEITIIDKLITKDVSVSVIKDMFRFYFKKKEMINLIIQLTQDLNQNENIPPDVIDLYKRHGILELFNEPLREDLHIKCSFCKFLEDDPNLFIAQKHWSFRVINTAKCSLKEDLSKKINKNGLIHRFSRELYEMEDVSTEKIEKYIIDTSDVKFYYISDSSSGSNRKKINKIEYIMHDKFNTQKGIPIDTKKEGTDKFYVVYKIEIDEFGKNRLDLGFYFDRFIEPEQSLGIELSCKDIFRNFQLLAFNFSSYTLGFDFELELGDIFKSDMSQQIIGKGHIVAKSKNHLSYSGWIMPHSSFSCSWTKK